MSTHYRIQAIQEDDVSAAAKIAADAFLVDRQTQMKNMGKEPDYMQRVMGDMFPSLLKNPRVAMLKITDPETGELMGFCNWGFRGFKNDEVPDVEGRVKQPQGPEPPVKPDSEEDKNTETKSEDQPESGLKESEEKDPLKRLEAFTSADMDKWMEEVMAPGIRCIYIITLNVAPKYQGRGVGTALLKWGTDFCDKNSVFAWVHSSEMAVPAYKKVGFKTMRSLDVDLDEYAPCPPPNEGPDAKWGHYVFQYMKYLPETE